MGFIVTRGGRPLILKEGVLWWAWVRTKADKVKLFLTRREAHNAIRRTKRYGKREGYPRWDKDYTVWGLDDKPKGK